MAITEDQMLGAKSDPTAFATPFRPVTPGLAAAASNEINYYLGGYFQQAKESVQFGTTIPADYDFVKYIPKGMEAYATAYSRTTSPEHAAEVTRYIGSRQDLRGDMADTPIGTALLGSLVNPVNWLPIPIGIAMRGAKASLTMTAARGALVVGGTEAALNIGIEATDPVQNLTETLINTTTAAVFGAGLTGLFSVPAVSRMNAITRVREQGESIFQSARALDDIGGVSVGAIDRFAPRESRPLGADDTVDAGMLEINSRIETLERELVSLPEGSGEARIIKDEIDQLRVAREPYADEIFYRKLEEKGVDLNDIYRPSAGLDNIMIRMVPTPMRSALFDNFGRANNAVKGAFMRLAGDGGTQLRIHEVGASAPLSVHQRQAKDMGEFALFYGEAVRLWAQDTNAPAIGESLLSNADINMTSIARKVQRDGNSIESWLTTVSRKRLAGEQMTPAQEQTAKLIDSYFAKWEERGIETGQLRTRETLTKRVNDLELEVQALRNNLEAVAVVDRDADRIARLEESEAQLAEARFELENPDTVGSAEPFFSRYWDMNKVKRNRDEFKQILINWFTENPYIIRYDQDAKKWGRVDLSTDAAAIAKRADEAIDTIVNGKANRDDAAIFFGAGRPSPLAARQLNIPNSRVLDFIELNPVSVLGNYTMRTSPSYHFAKEFGANRSKTVENLRKQMRDAGMSEEKIQKTVMRFNHLYDRVVGRVVQNPEAWNQKVAATLRDMASLTYLGGAGIAAVGDLGRIVMEHEGQNIVRAAQAMFDPVLRRSSRQEVRVAGGALDMLLGSVFMRMVDDQNFNLLNNGVMDRAKNVFHTLNLLGPVTTTAKQFSGMLSGHHFIELSQRVVSGTASDFDIRYLARHGIDQDLARRIAESPYQVDSKTGLILPNADSWAGNYKPPTVDGQRVRIVEAVEGGEPVGKKGPNGEYIPAFYRPDEEGPGGTIYFDRDYIEGPMFESKAWTKPRMEGVKALPEDAFKTPREWANFVMLHEIAHTRFSAEDLGLPPKSAAYENKINEMAMKEHKASQQVAADTADRFRVAVNTAINNTVMMAGPADKPIMMDGVIYVREEIGARIGLEPDPKNPGYSRVENAFIALPLQFYSYALANVSKTVGLMMQGAVRSRTVGIAAMMGLGYMVTAIRTPERVWDNMSIQDKVARSFDMSGVAALYSDLFYTALQTSLAVGGPNFTGGFIQPRFPQQPNAVDAVTGLTGAASSWTADMVRSASAFADGRYGEGASMFIKNLPFSNIWFMKGEINEMARTLSRY
jgi:hypothetical protein